MSNQLRVKGYVHNVTPTSKSRVGFCRSFKFELQVNESRKRRVVCYDPGQQKVLKSFEESREPVKFMNFSGKRSATGALEEEIVLTKRSRVEAANNDYILFEYEEPTPQEAEQTFTKIGLIESVAEFQVISVKGCLTLCPDCVRQVIKKDGSVVQMLNRCALTDDSGTVRMTLWGNTIGQVTNHSSYTLENVLVKQYDLAKYLTTTDSTTMTPIQEEFRPPSE